MTVIDLPLEAVGVLQFWFPDNGFWHDRPRYAQWLYQRMQGGMDAEICGRFADLTVAAARGQRDDWADTARGRLALILVLDQFSRSLWRNTAAAYAQDCKATRLAIEGIQNGHFAVLAPWEKLFYIICIGHCEGPDHLQRMDLIDEVTKGIIAEFPEALAGSGNRLLAQNARVRSVIERFGRHPHRNPIYGRVSTPEEEAYIAAGDFPHLAMQQPQVSGTK